LHDLVWDGEQGRLTFQLLAADHDAFALTILLPANFTTPLAGTSSAGKMVVQVEVDGLPVDFAINPVAGEPHAWISVSPGQHTVDVWYADP
ncbi:MAG: hypothetical protein ACE5EY_14755, partial [Anaerolineae bacterium]